MPGIRDARILIIAADGFEQLELTVPRDELRKAGAQVDVATPSGSAIRGWNKTDWGDSAPADLKIANARPDDYDAIVLPGGVINPDKLRVDGRHAGRQGLPRQRQGGRRHLPRAVAPGAGRRGARPADDVLRVDPQGRRERRGRAGSTSRSWSTTASSPAAAPTISGRSFPRSSRRSRKAAIDAGRRNSDRVCWRKSDLRDERQHDQEAGEAREHMRGEQRVGDEAVGLPNSGGKTRQERGGQHAPPASARRRMEDSSSKPPRRRNPASDLAHPRPSSTWKPISTGFRSFRNQSRRR